jgi:hypothetical protein
MKPAHFPREEDSRATIRPALTWQTSRYIQSDPFLLESLLERLRALANFSGPVVR